jgi:hypothetical protein
MTDDRFNDNDFARLADAMGLTLDQARALKVKPTESEKRAAAQAVLDENAKKPPMTKDDVRAQKAAELRRALDQRQPGHGYSDEDIERAVAVTYSDEAQDENKRLWLANQKAEREQRCAQSVVDVAAKKSAAKVTRIHDDRLAHEKAATTVETERADKAEWTARGLQAQIDGLLKGQRS